MKTLKALAIFDKLTPFLIGGGEKVGYTPMQNITTKVVTYKEILETTPNADRIEKLLRLAAY